VTLEVKLVVRAASREDAMLTATETNRITERLESLRVTNVFCPAEGE
jgi:hypothetical protein